MRGLVAFGAPLMGLTEADLSEPGLGLQIGIAPGPIDVLTKIRGLAFDEAWPGRVQADFGEGVRCSVIGLSELLRNKRASGRPQDLADVDALERLARAKTQRTSPAASHLLCCSPCTTSSTYTHLQRHPMSASARTDRRFCSLHR